MDKKPLIFLAIVGVLFGFIFCRKNQRSSSALRKQDNSAVITDTGSSPGADRQSSGMSSGYIQDKVSIRDSVPTTPAIGAAYFSTEDGVRGVGVRMAPLLWCVKGDVDRILEVQRAHQSTILITLEPVDVSDSKKKSIVHKLSEADLRNGRDLLFQVEPSSPTVFALMVCTDSRGENRCLGKPPADMHIDFDYFVSAIRKNSNQDLIFYTHLLTLDKNNFQVFQTSPAIQAIVDTFAAAKNKNNLNEQELERAKYILEIINAGRPNPVTVVYDGGAGTTVNLNLSLQEQARCARD